MIEQDTAVAVATGFLKAKAVEVERFAEARFLPEEGIWICSFLNKTPTGCVDAPAITIVEVNDLTGAASFFDAI